MACCLPSKRLKRVLLPTLGRPTIATTECMTQVFFPVRGRLPARGLPVCVRAPVRGASRFGPRGFLPAGLCFRCSSLLGFLGRLGLGFSGTVGSRFSSERPRVSV